MTQLNFDSLLLEVDLTGIAIPGKTRSAVQ